jgi:ATP-dependent helicase/DNAse subunit B
VTWSYSALQAFETCPWRYYLTRISRQAKESQTAATLEGNAVHKALELHVSGRQSLPDKYKQWLPLVERIKKEPGRIEAEVQFGLTPQFTPTTFFAKDVWLRGKFDVRITHDKRSTILDWKTGKPKPDIDQLKLFAAVEFKLNPYIEVVQTGYVWLHSRAIDREVFVRDQSSELWKDFVVRVRRLEHAMEKNAFPKRPSGLCRQYCPVGKQLCEHCGS